MARAWCKHYRGMHLKDSCEAGIRFASLPGYGTSEFDKSCPCFGRGSGCDHAVYPTPEEIAADQAESERRNIALNKARKAIVESIGDQRGFAQGVIDCPACGSNGSLQFSRSGYNGHIHAHCTTEGCVSWME